MAESATTAFGRYLRALRLRRGLSLLDAERLSRHSTEKIDKGTISRFERGLQMPTLYKLSPLCRIYEIPSDAVLERLELDRQVEQRGEPGTDGLSFEELRERGRKALVHGTRKWDAYAYFRDALVDCPDTEYGAAWSNLVTAIRSLGKSRLALHELLALKRLPSLTPIQHVIADDRIANCHRSLGDLYQARLFAEQAIERALQLDDLRTLAFTYNTRAHLALDLSQHRVAIDYLHRSYRAYRNSVGRESVLLPNPYFECNALQMLAECYFYVRRYAASHRAALAAQTLAKRHDVQISLAYSEFLLGRVDNQRGATEQALRRWTRASDLARESEDHRVAFLAEYEIYRQAENEGAPARARAACKRLERLAPWVPQHLAELRDFKRRTRSL